MTRTAKNSGHVARVGDRLIFLGYKLPVPFIILEPGNIVAVASVRPDGEYIVFPIDGWGRVFSLEGETVFDDEVLKLPLIPIPTKRLPPPYGESDNEGDFRGDRHRLPKS